MTCTPGALLSTAGRLFLVMAAACGGGGGSSDAGSPDAPGAADAASPADSGPDALVIDAPVLPQGATCTDPFILAPGGSDSQDSSQFAAQTTASCSAGTSAALEVKYLVDMGTTPRDLVARVSVDETADPPYDAVLYARTECTKLATEVACADAGWSERIDVLAATGNVYLLVDGTSQHGGLREGSYTLTTSVRDIVAESGACDPAGVTSRCADGFRCVAGTCSTDSAAVACGQATVLDVSSGSATATATTFAYAADWYQGSCAYDPAAALPEHVYKLSIPAGADLVASTNNPATDFDTDLYLRSSTCDGAEIACADDVDPENHNLTSTLTATNLAGGTYYLFVDGSSNSPGTGTYQLDITVTP